MGIRQQSNGPTIEFPNVSSSDFFPLLTPHEKTQIQELIDATVVKERARIFSGVNELIDFRLRLIARQAMSANGASEADLAAVDMGLNDLRVHLQAEFGIEITLDEDV